MPSRPSEPLLAFLRDAIRKKGMNTADLAARVGVERSQLKAQLGGTADMTVDALIALSRALELTPAEMGLGGEGTSDDAPPAEGATVEAAPSPPDPFGNLARQVVEHGIQLGVDLFFVLDARQLGGSGVPAPVLAANTEQLRLRMEARWFPQNRFRFADEALTCALSFDALYTCTLPWTAFRSVIFLLPEEAPVAPAPEPPTPAKGAPFLRVVK